ncbi:hypothetical protein BLNAU_19897 [Blattamonas nauphoetae]|uniref:Uncharacterized protein n=1 Tax=Blattamonas nauphoetae TaxID=2049346 RepID=A0ABQ9X064_9EUKA|nr:hypothetical protein BLNAU_19897 [Blattamonas nauphoetae]
MPKDKNDQSQLNQFMNKIDGAVTRALQADYIRKGFEKCGLILSGHVLSDPYFLHRWFEHNAAQNGLKRRGKSLAAPEMNGGERQRLGSLRSSKENNSESSISLGHDEEFDDVAFIHDPNESDDDDSLSGVNRWEPIHGRLPGKGKLVLQAHSKHRRKFPPVGYRMTRLISYISPSPHQMLPPQTPHVALFFVSSDLNGAFGRLVMRLVLISNVVLALKLGLSLERLSSTAVMQMKILKEQNLDHLEIVGQEERRLHVVRVGGVTGNGEESGHRVRYGVWTNSLLITQRIKD